MQSNKVAIVCPWFGRDLTGGAEKHTWEICTRLAARGHEIEVLTTCSRTFQGDWHSNPHKPGCEEIEGVWVRRFRLSDRNSIAFDEANRALLGQFLDSPLPSTQINKEFAASFAHHNLNSQDLYAYIVEHIDDYRYFVFIPYLYGTSILGMQFAADKAILHPCLHDEIYAYLPEIEKIFSQAHSILCLSAGEKALVSQLYGPAVSCKTSVVGAGVDPAVSSQSVLLPEGLASDFILCLGRREVGKGVDFLISAWKQFRALNPKSQLQLVFAGPGSFDYSDEGHNILDLGLVDDALKQWLLEHARVLAQPSRNESYSRVLMEAWRVCCPAIVHKACLATDMAMQESAGGWRAGDIEDWVEVLAHVATLSKEVLIQFGQKGAHYAERYANWEKVIDEYEKALGLSSVESLKHSIPHKVKAFHQLLPTLRSGDAISNQAVWFQKIIRGYGLTSDIYVKTCSPELINDVKLVTDGCPPDNSALLFHHSIGNEITQIAFQHKGPKSVLYHNITPHTFFESYEPDFAQLLQEGRAELPVLTGHFKSSYADSQYNAEELEEVGFRNSQVVPIIVDASRWDLVTDRQLGALFGDGLKNFLFIGRVAPNKGHHELIDAFYQYLCLDPNARLILAGYVDHQSLYTKELLAKIEAYGIRSRVFLLGDVNEEKLYTLYRCASLFWSFSKHEGFCVPVVEAMWFDIPVAAMATTAVPETMSYAGLLFEPTTSAKECAALVFHLMHDLDLQNKVISAQKRRREDFTLASLKPYVYEMIDAIDTGSWS